MEYNYFSENLQKCRLKNKITQIELAQKLGVSTDRVAEWESAEVQPEVDDVISISDILGVTVDELLADPNKNKTSKKRLGIILVSILLSAMIIVASTVGIILISNNLSKPFSKDTNAIAIAEESVVKVYCYDYYGNEIATGSGIIAFDDKTLVTNQHVIESGHSIKVSSNQDITYTVNDILVASKEKDIAILRISEDTELTPLTFGDPSLIKKGETVTSIGSPLGIKNSISQGILSGRYMEPEYDALQFTASISHGSSGGALFNESGEVIGITYGSFVDGQNLNLAIPIDEVEKAYEKWSKTKRTTNVADYFMENNPQYRYLGKYKDALSVTLDELKRNPSKYNGKTIILNTYVSSTYFFRFSGHEEYNWSRYYLSNKEDVTGDHDFDESLRLEIDDKFLPFIQSSFLFSDYEGTNIQAGDYVTVIGTFEYERDGTFPVEGMPALDGDVLSIAINIIFKAE